MSTTRYSASRLSYNSTLQPPAFDNEIPNYNIYTNNNANNNSFYNSSMTRSKSPGLDAELKGVKKSGKDYHVTVNLNALLAANQINNINSSNINFETLRNQQTFNKNLVRESTTTTNVMPRNFNNGTLNNNSNQYSNSKNIYNSNNNYYNNNSNIPLTGLARRTVVNLNGEDDASLYAYQQQQQQQLFLSQQRQPSPRQHLLTTVSPTNYKSLSVSSSISPQFIQTPIVENAYTVKSITSSSNVPKQQSFVGQPASRKDTVEFNLQLNGQVIKQAPPQIITQPPTDWTVYGGVPIQAPPPQPQHIDDTFTSRTNQRVIVEDDGDDESEEDDDEEEEEVPLKQRTGLGRSLPNEAPRKSPRETYNELHDMTKNNWWLNLEYGSAPKVRTESERQKTLPRETTTESIDVILEQVKLELSNYMAKANVEVRSERIIPINLREKLYSVTAVIVTKNIEFDMNSSDEAMGLYENALAMERRSGGKLSNDDIKNLFVQMVEINKNIPNSSQQNVKYDNFITSSIGGYGNRDGGIAKVSRKKNQYNNDSKTIYSNISNGSGYGSHWNTNDNSKKKPSMKGNQVKLQRF